MKTASRARGHAVAHATAIDPAAEQHRLDLERSVMEADRMLMQTLQTSLSMIGFGFTINAFFNDVVSSGALPASADLTARRVGLALLSLGLLFLATSLVVQARYRRQLAHRHRSATRAGLPKALLRGAANPTFLTAFLLLLVGLTALASILIRGFI